mmetsp:Transcript_3155/g.9800  ORF Transcript_3155/g.9800 Transcript_3155/m.9800 type:complete len:176 (+) Transcript_3155:3266-3793(+)
MPNPDNMQVYSGASGSLMRVDVFVGVVFYQRLRHMVADKSQVRSTGPVHQLTLQPVKGRKRHGGIRLGEMERDSLVAHGTAFVLRDRLLECSDVHTSHVCSDPRCLAMIRSFELQPDAPLAQCRQVFGRSHSPNGMYQCCKCRVVQRSRQIVLPYIFRYLAEEVAGMNVKLALDL